MTREELKAHCEKQIEMCEMWAYGKGEEPSGKIYEEHKLILELLEQKSCDDAISRQAAIDAMRKNHRSGGRDIDGDYIEGDYRECLYDDILHLPSVTPQPKMGKWVDIMVGDMPAQVCDKCNTFYPLAYTGGGHKYCPNCGAKMIEPQESEDEG